MTKRKSQKDKHELVAEREPLAEPSAVLPAEAGAVHPPAAGTLAKARALA